MTSQNGPIRFEQWHIPGLVSQLADSVIHEEEKNGTPVDSVRSTLIKEALRVLQPAYNPQYRCSVMLIGR